MDVSTTSAAPLGRAAFEPRMRIFEHCGVGMPIPVFTYSTDDFDGYELLVSVDGASVLVVGTLLHNNGLGDLMRAGTAIATGARYTDTWHGSAFHQYRLRFQIITSPKGEERVRILAHEADGTSHVGETVLLDAVAGSRLDVALAIRAGVAPFVSRQYSDDLAYAS